MTDSLARKEVEITPEMTEAGAAVIREYDLGWDVPADVAKKVFRAMYQSMKLDRPS